MPCGPSRNSLGDPTAALRSEAAAGRGSTRELARRLEIRVGQVVFRGANSRDKCWGPRTGGLNTSGNRDGRQHGSAFSPSTRQAWRTSSEAASARPWRFVLSVARSMLNGVARGSSLSVRGGRQHRSGLYNAAPGCGQQRERVQVQPPTCLFDLRPG